MIGNPICHCLIVGNLYPSACVASWSSPVNVFVAGTKVTVLILPRDAFGNNITSTSVEITAYNFTISAFYENGTMASNLSIVYTGWKKLGYFSIDFIATIAGSLLLHVEGGNQSLNGCPLPFKVNPGDLFLLQLF